MINKNTMAHVYVYNVICIFGCDLVTNIPLINKGKNKDILIDLSTADRVDIALTYLCVMV